MKSKIESKSLFQVRMSLKIWIAGIIILLMIESTVAAIITVPIDYDNITSAVSASNDGDIINVNSGLYNESFFITKTISLNGVDTGMGLPIIYNYSQIVITVNKNNVTISDFILQDSDWGIRFNQQNGSSINNTIQNMTSYGIITGGHRTTVRNNTINSTGIGISLSSSDYTSIYDTELTNNSYGMYLVTSKNNSIYNNLLDNNTIGIFTDAISEYNIIDNNTFNNSGNHGIYLHDSNNTNLSYNTFYGNDILLHNSSNNSIIYNYIDNNNISSSYGIYLQQSSDFNNISHNTVENGNTVGIALDGGTTQSIYNIVNNNSVYNSGTIGVSIYRSSNNSFNNNYEITSLIGFAIQNLSNDNSFINNIISNNSVSGLLVVDSENNLINNNSINLTPQSISFDNVTNSTSILINPSVVSLINANTTLQAYELFYITPSTNITISTTDIVSNISGSDTYSIIDINSSIIPNNTFVVFNIITWNTTGDYYKKWNESSSNASVTTQHIIGDFPANTNIQIKRDGVNYAQLTSNSTGYINWTYSGGYSEHQFEAEIMSLETTISVWDSDTQAIDLWADISGVLKLMIFGLVLSFIFIVIKSGVTNKTIEQLVAICIGILTLVVIYAVIPILGSLLSELV